MNSTIARLVSSRLAVGVLTLLIVSLVVFFLTSLLPGDAVQEQLGQDATPEAVAAMRAVLGLDQPVYLRYLHWLGGLITGTPGVSLVNGMAVDEMIASRLPNTLRLASIAALVSVPLALTIGILSAMYRGSIFDRYSNMLAVFAVSVPEFLIATVAVLIFAVKLGWLSALSRDVEVESFGELVRVYAMPVLTLCCVLVAQMARMTRAALIDQLSSPYVEMAVLKGARPIRVVLRHALPNAIGPIANAIALSLSYLLGGVVIVESIFNYPGIATLMVNGVVTRDMPLVQACVMLFCLGFLVLVLLADLCAILSNPRLRK
ncbi:MULTISPECIES: ABC transporter permease [Pseudomonas]|uniref:ABC transporter permease n=1 Tax=Pseudomonas TaxID=286 RepID=UPI001199554B|nr:MULTISPECIES: ABC transporter permease [Pseudomonas]TWC17540.1 peptide/nickel transport system permease protein [Pseudomonas sp. SJZ074]TWC19667.1 peptide/nickel transport system permease protein [Pseudomonas sp. SJZ075]TWC35433.1 peptide/nickel transport system permease protein [Pseudomonas sp. SJZ078]TWC35550.1 peptide/nickel transport system permease protein [Pseudomonas sp. SJZ085]TWC56379.1 peptide/nickel transport system permease protein [Pseudomonas sp. SJZ124]